MNSMEGGETHGAGNEALWNAIPGSYCFAGTGAILVAALTSDGYVATAFKEELTGFFGRMSTLAGT